MANKKEKSSAKSGLKSAVFATLGTVLLGLPVGFFLTDLIASSKPKTMEVNAPSEVDASAESADAEGNETRTPAPLAVVALPPVITNISDPSTMWVRLEGSLLFDTSKEGDTAVVAAKLSQHVVVYLNTLKLTDIQGAGAIHALSQDLNEIVTSMSDGQVQGFLLSGLVFE
jgi:flagellar protein FliL